MLSEKYKNQLSSENLETEKNSKYVKEHISCATDTGYTQINEKEDEILGN